MGQRAEGRERPRRHAAEARLQAINAAKTRGYADRSAAVGTERKRRQARCEGGGRAARGAAWRLRGVPGVARDAGQRAVGRTFPAEFRRRGLADQHRPRFAQSRDRRRIVRPRSNGVDSQRTASRRPASREQQVLDRDGHAVERGQWRGRHPAGLRGLRRRARRVWIDQAEGVDLRVECFDAGETCRDDVHGRQLAFAVGLRQLGGSQFVNVDIHWIGSLARVSRPFSTSRIVPFSASRIVTEQLPGENTTSRSSAMAAPTAALMAT